MDAERSLLPIIKEMEDTKRLLCPGAPQGPAQYMILGTKMKGKYRVGSVDI